MDKLGVIIGGGFLIIVFLVLTAMIISVAPYLALLVLLGVTWAFIPKAKDTSE